MKQFQRYIKVVFVLLLAVTSMGIQSNANVLAEEGLGNEDINIVLNQNYNKETNTEDIKFGVQAKTEGIQILEVLNSEYNAQLNDENTYNYTVNENGSYEYTINYQLSNNERKEYKFIVDVNSIQIKKEKSIIQPQIEVSDQKVKVEIPDYDETVGWQATDMAKVMYVNVKFDPNSSNKKLDITLPMGMHYDKYRILDPISGSTLEEDLDGTLKDMVTNTTRPSLKIGDSTYGTLSYEFGQGAESVRIELSIAVDPSMVTKDTVIADGIKVKAEENNQSIGSVEKDINANNEEINPGFFILNSKVIALENQENILLPNYTLVTNFANRKGYFSEITITYYYPKEFTFVRMDRLQSGYSAPVVNEQEGSVSVRYENVVIDGYPNPNIYVSGNGVTEGEYIADSFPKIEAYNFQGELVTQNRQDPSNQYTKIEVVKQIDNKLDLLGYDGYYYNSQDDYYTNGPMFYISNDNVSEKTDQIYEVSIDSNYQTAGVNIPYDYSHNQNGIDVYYKTNKSSSKWIKANKSAIIFEKKYGTNGYTATITKKSLQLDEDEYFIAAKGYIGTVSKGFESSTTDAKWTVGMAPSVNGKLIDGVNTAKVNVKTYSEEAGSIETGSETSVINNVTRNSNGSTSIDRNMKLIALNAGETKEQIIELGAENYRYGNHTMLNSPTIYLRVPEGVTYSNFKVRSLMNGVYKNVSYDLSEPYVSTISGETFIKLKVNENFGSGFGDNVDMKKLIVSFDIYANIQSETLNLNWKDYAFVQDGVFSSVTNGLYNRKPGAIADALDVNNNGNITEKITPIYVADYKVSSKTGLLVDTFITPKGESKKDPYYGNEDTAVAFKPETEATYSVDMFNNTKEELSEIRVYLPVPKEGNNYGTNLQDTAFSWNMKLKGTPTIKVYDVNNIDVTTSRKDAYKIEYSSNATNESNYIGATYGSSIANSTSMIRITNTEDIPNGERVVLEFPYEVDETDASITAKPEKLGSVNDFSPYYYFKSTNTSGYLSGTKVGAILSIGTIEGVVFLDNNTNGIYDAGDALSFNGGTVNLYASDNTSGIPDATTTVGSNGKYKFTGLDIKNYTLDFSDIAGQFQKFSVTSEEENGSKVDYIGANVGKVQNVNTALRSSKSVYAGIINYQAPTITSESDLYFKRGSIVPDLFLRTLANIRTTGYFTDAVQFDQRAVNFSEEGMYQVNLSVSDAYGGTATTTFNVHVMDTIFANGFIIPLTDVADADFESLANAGAVDVSTPTQIRPTSISLQGKKPTTAGLHEVTFKAGTGETIKVNVLVYSGTITNNEVIEADNFAVTLKNLKDADMKVLADAKGYDVSDPTDVKEISIQTVTAKPTTVGLHPIEFRTANGATREVTAIVSDNAPNEKNEVVIAKGFEVELSEVEAANFVTLANAKGYDVTDINNPTEISVKLTSTKPTSIGTYKARFETENKAHAEVNVKVYSSSGGDEDEEKIYANDFSYGISQGTLTEAKAKELASISAYGEDGSKLNLSQVSVNSDQLQLINDKIDADISGEDKYPLTFTTPKGVAVKIKVTLTDKGSEKDDEHIYGNNFTYKITQGELTEAKVKELANVYARKASGITISLDKVTVKKNELDAINKAITDKNISGNPYKLTFSTDSGSSVTIDVTLKQGEIKIVDDFFEDDGIVVIYRTGDTGEKAPAYLPNGYSPTYDLKLQIGGEDMREADLAKVTWTTEEAGGFSSILTYIETKDGSSTITAKKSGVVKLVANYEGVTDSIYVVIPGDVDRNGMISAVDAGRVQNYAKSKKKSDLGKDDEFTFFLVDMNGDKNYSQVDAGIIQNMAKKQLKPSN